MKELIEVEQNEEKIEEDGRREKKLYVEALKNEMHDRVSGGKKGAGEAKNGR